MSTAPLPASISAQERASIRGGLARAAALTGRNESGASSTARAALSAKPASSQLQRLAGDQDLGIDSGVEGWMRATETPVLWAIEVSVSPLSTTYLRPW